MWTFTPTEFTKLDARRGIPARAGAAARRHAASEAIAAALNAFVRVFDGKLSELPCRVPADERPLGNRARDHRARRHHRVVADADSRQDDRGSADPDVPADVHGLDLPSPARLDLMEVRIVDRRQVADEDVVADAHVLRGMQGNAAIDEYAVADLEEAVRPRVEVAAELKPVGAEAVPHRHAPAVRDQRQPPA